jgi:hypothetical protein
MTIDLLTAMEAEVGLTEIMTGVVVDVEVPESVEVRWVALEKFP